MGTVRSLFLNRRLIEGLPGACVEIASRTIVALAQLPEPFEGGVFDDGLGERHCRSYAKTANGK